MSFGRGLLKYNLPNNLQIIEFKRLPFLGKLSLKLSAIRLKNFLNKLNCDCIIKARGPLSAWLCLKVNYKNILVQARGILVEEYKMAHTKNNNFVKNLFHAWRSNQLRKIEKEVYTNKEISIESVSNALKKYLIEKYNTSTERIFISQNDIPKPISLEQKTTWSKEVRKKLDIPYNCTVYCYNGSAKAWQCPSDTVLFFKERIKTNPNIFLLILSQDKETFITLLKGINPIHYKITTVKHQEVLPYLSACDYGLLFREKNIVNWVSRPTKALEYKAAHLKIIHNNTVEYLIIN